MAMSHESYHPRSYGDHVRVADFGGLDRTGIRREWWMWVKGLGTSWLGRCPLRTVLHVPILSVGSGLTAGVTSLCFRDSFDR